MPDAADISITAVSVSDIKAYFALIGLPRGSLTLAYLISPFRPSARASTVPSPPSANGYTETLASGSAILIPSAALFPASAEVRLPLKESIAIVYFILFSV